MQGFIQRMKKDGWLLAALAAAAFLCLLLGAQESDINAMTQEEARIARILSAIEGAGTVDVVIYYAEGKDGMSLPCGAVIVADGAGEIGIRIQLSRALQTLLGIDNSRIEIFKRGEG